MQSPFLVVLAILLSPFTFIPDSVHNSRQAPGTPAVNNAGIFQKTRVFNHHMYEVVDTAYFIVYRSSKTVEKIPNKGPMVVTQYYFSKTASDDIYELSITNLEKVFPGNIRFHYFIEQQFRSEKDLIAYDNFVKAYKIKYLFSESLINK